jgi:isoleucyl-tRNA synthetase
VHHELRPNFRVLGKRLGKQMKAVQKALAAADGDALAEELEQSGRISLAIGDESIELGPGDVEVRLIEKEEMATAGDRDLLVVLDTHLTPELIAEGRARELVNRIQTARKEAGLDYADRIRVRYRAHPELESVLETHREWIAGETLTTAWETAGGDETELDATEIDGFGLDFSLAKD